MAGERGSVMEGYVEDAGDSRGRGSRRGQLVARLTAATPDFPAFVNELVTNQAVVVSGTEAAAFAVQKSEDGVSLTTIAHVRNDNADEETRKQALQAFAELLKPCVQQGKDGAIEIEGTGIPGVDEAQYCLVTLLKAEGEVHAITAVIARAPDLDRAQQKLLSMQLIAGYFELFHLRRVTQEHQLVAVTHQSVLQMAAASSQSAKFQTAANNLCNEMITRLGASRVSLGWVIGTQIKVKAISHTEQFDKKQEMVVQLQRVMEECADQEQPVYFIPGEEGGIVRTREARTLVATQQAGSVWSVPLRYDQEVCGVLTVEFPPGYIPPPTTDRVLTTAAELIGGQLHDRYQNDRFLATKMGIHARRWGELLLGPKHMLAKLACGSLLLALLIITLVKIDYRVTAPFQFSTVDKRIISVPFEGFLGSIATEDGTPAGKRIRAGSVVTKGQLLAALDTRELVARRAKAEGERNAARKQADKSMVEGKTAESQIARYRAEASEAEVNLLAEQIARAEIRSPMDGEVLRSEVDDRIDSPVRAGDVLFEIAQKDKLRVELHVNERDVQRLLKDQTGYLATSSLPGERHAFRVDRIVPQGQPKEGANTFTVYGELTDIAPGWRPGMAGEAKIDVGRERIVYVWTHRLIDWLRLKLWI